MPHRLRVAERPACGARKLAVCAKTAHPRQDSSFPPCTHTCQECATNEHKPQHALCILLGVCWGLAQRLHDWLLDACPGLGVEHLLLVLGRALRALITPCSGSSSTNSTVCRYGACPGRSSCCSLQRQQHNGWQCVSTAIQNACVAPAAAQCTRKALLWNDACPLPMPAAGTCIGAVLSSALHAGAVLAACKTAWQASNYAGQTLFDDHVA